MTDLEEQLRRYGAAVEEHVRAGQIQTEEVVHRRPGRWLLVATAAALAVGVAGAAFTWLDEPSRRVSAAGPAPTAPTSPTYGFPPLTPLLDEAPGVISDTNVIVTDDAGTMSFSLSPDRFSETLTPEGDIGSGSMSGDPMFAPAIDFSMQGQASNDPAPPRRFIIGVTRSEVARIDWVKADRTVSVDTVRVDAFPQLRFILMQDIGASDWTGDDIPLLRAYNEAGDLLTDTARIKAEEGPFQAAMQTRAQRGARTSAWKTKTWSVATAEGDATASVMAPSTWYFTADDLTPNAGNPDQIFAAATWLPPVGGNDSCAQFPAAAIEAMRPTDALVVIYQRQAMPDAASFPPRPSTFRKDEPGTDESGDCVPNKPFIHQWIPFQDHGGAFYLYVAYGADATTATRDSVWNIADSFTLADPATAPGSAPPP